MTSKGLSDGRHKWTEETTRVTASVASTLGVNIFAAPGKAMVGERTKPFGEPPGFPQL
jgi:hypothetical protein